MGIPPMPFNMLGFDGTSINHAEVIEIKQVLRAVLIPLCLQLTSVLTHKRTHWDWHR